MSSVTRQLDAGSLNSETGAVTGLLERRKLCLRSATLRMPRSLTKPYWEELLIKLVDGQEHKQEYHTRTSGDNVDIGGMVYRRNGGKGMAGPAVEDVVPELAARVARKGQFEHESSHSSRGAQSQRSRCGTCQVKSG